MRLLRRLFGLTESTAGTASCDPMPAHREDQPPARVDMLQAPSFGEDVLAGWEYCATLQMRTPASILRRHRKFAPYSTDGPPTISDQMWHGIWIPIVKGPDFPWPDKTMSSEVGYVPADGGDYLPFLIEVRTISESPGPVEAKEAALRALAAQIGPRGTPYAQFLNADALVDRVLPLAVFQLPVPANVARALHAGGFTTLRLVGDATDSQLLAVKGVGPKSLEAIRAFLAGDVSDRDAERYVAHDFATT